MRILEIISNCVCANFSGFLEVHPWRLWANVICQSPRLLCSTKELRIHKDARRFMEIATQITTITMRICTNHQQQHVKQEGKYQLNEMLGYLWNQCNQINSLPKWEFFISWTQGKNKLKSNNSSNNNLQHVLDKIC